MPTVRKRKIIKTAFLPAPIGTSENLASIEKSRKILFWKAFRTTARFDGFAIT